MVNAKRFPSIPPLKLPYFSDLDPKGECCHMWYHYDIPHVVVGQHQKKKKKVFTMYHYCGSVTIAAPTKVRGKKEVLRMCNRIRYKLAVEYTESPFKQEIRAYCFDLSKASGVEDLFEFLSMFRVKPFRKILDVELFAEGGHEEV